MKWFRVVVGCWGAACVWEKTNTIIRTLLEECVPTLEAFCEEDLTTGILRPTLAKVVPLPSV